MPKLLLSQPGHHHHHHLYHNHHCTPTIKRFTVTFSCWLFHFSLISPPSLSSSSPPSPAAPTSRPTPPSWSSHSCTWKDYNHLSGVLDWSASVQCPSTLIIIMEPEKMKTISFSTWAVSPLAEVLQPQQKPCGQKCNQLHKERVVDDLNVNIMTMKSVTFLALLETTSREGRLILSLKQARGFHLHILSFSLGSAYVSYQSLMITTLVSMQLNAILQYYDELLNFHSDQTTVVY